MSYEYRKDQELEGIPLEWLDRDGAVKPFASGYTFSAKITAVSAPSTILVTKSAGITGADVSPNITIDWSTTDFSTLPAAAGGTDYLIYLYARRTADSKDNVFRPGNPIRFTLYPAPA